MFVYSSVSTNKIAKIAIMEIKQILDKRCPNIVEIIGKDKIKFWSKVDLKYNSRLAFIKNELNNKRDVSIRKSIIDNLIASKDERNEAEAFLKEIDFRIGRVYEDFKRDNKLIDKFRHILQQLILTEIKDSKSIDRVGEIFAIDYIVLKKQLKIIELESKLENGKHLDCLVKSIDSDKIMFFDFLSINIDTCKVESQEGLSKLLIHRIVTKYEDKVKNIEKLNIPFKVFPILWLEIDLLRKYHSFLSESESILNTDFYVLTGIENITDENFQYKFGTINELNYWF